jgi:hypothetical protein
VAGEYGGRRTICPKCRTRIRVPAAYAHPLDDPLEPPPAARTIAVPPWAAAAVLAVNAGLLVLVAVVAWRGGRPAPAPAVAESPPPAAPQTTSVSRPPGEPAWLTATEAAVAAARAAGRRPAVEAPYRPPAVGDAEWASMSRAADAILARLGGQARLLDDASVVTAVTVLDAGRGAFGQVYPRCERAYVREALIAPAVTHDQTTVRSLLTLGPVYRPLADEDYRRNLAARPPASERRRLYARFSAAAGISDTWTPLIPWEDLPSLAMAALPGVCERINTAGIKVASSEEVGWLLAADAVEYVAAAIVAERHEKFAGKILVSSRDGR